MMDHFEGFLKIGPAGRTKTVFPPKKFQARAKCVLTNLVTKHVKIHGRLVITDRLASIVRLGDKIYDGKFLTALQSR